MKPTKTSSGAPVTLDSSDNLSILKNINIKLINKTHTHTQVDNLFTS